MVTFRKEVDFAGVETFYYYLFLLVVWRMTERERERVREEDNCTISAWYSVHFHISYV